MQMYLFDECEGEQYEAPGKALDLTRLFELSIDAFYAALYAEMSELPVKAEIERFVEKVVKASAQGKDARAAAARAATDRGDPDVFVVLGVADKVRTEIHRLTGFLRFNPDSEGVYIARCAPDYFILPALAEHFTQRFGEAAWAIIDEKRGVSLYCENGGPAKLVPVSNSDPSARTEKIAEDFWEELWRLHHRLLSNKARENPSLQRQLMPKRYHKYLPEMK